MPGAEEPYVFVTAAGGAGLKLRSSEPAAVCQVIMDRAKNLAMLNRKHGGGKKDFLAQLRNTTEAAWCGGARAGQRLVAVNGTGVKSMADVSACLKEASSWVTTLTFRSGPIVIGNVAPDGTAIRAEPSLQCGLRLLSVNGEPVAGRSFSGVTKLIKTTPRPLTLELQTPIPPPPIIPGEEQDPNATTPLVRLPSNDPEVSDGDRAMLKHHAAAQIEHVTNGMVLAKRSGITYVGYLMAKMPEDYNNEFVTFERKNERYHDMWNTLTAEVEVTHKYTDPETNAILDVDAIADADNADTATTTATAESTTTTQDDTTPD